MPPMQNTNKLATGRGRATTKTATPTRTGSHIAMTANTNTAAHTAETLIASHPIGIRRGLGLSLRRGNYRFAVAGKPETARFSIKVT
jgi:hypothetical protein